MKTFTSLYSIVFAFAAISGIAAAPVDAESSSAELVDRAIKNKHCSRAGVVTTDIEAFNETESALEKRNYHGVCYWNERFQPVSLEAQGRLTRGRAGAEFSLAILLFSIAAWFGRTAFSVARATAYAPSRLR